MHYMNMLTEGELEGIAGMAHNANRSYCQSLGDSSQSEWNSAPEWQKESVRVGVDFVLNNPDAPASANHDSWMESKRIDGWSYGPVKGPDNKRHPCMIPFAELSSDQQIKDILFRAVVLGAADYFINHTN